jgi:formylmethanofuran dehydrogenase subunit E
MNYSEIVRFHGHACPGLAIGYRMATAAIERLEVPRAEDEELVAIVENNACGVDALQCVTGCTFGKGNLLFRDYGKRVFTLYSRKNKRGIRVVFHGHEIPDQVRENREALAEWILNAPQEAILSAAPAILEEPDAAEVQRSVNCSFCGERVMESRLRQIDGKPACIPCTELRKPNK